MPVLLLFVFRFVHLLLSGHQAAAIENAALRTVRGRSEVNSLKTRADTILTTDNE